jgi:LPXTG-motif cell wall-anchored protein
MAEKEQPLQLQFSVGLQKLPEKASPEAPVVSAPPSQTAATPVVQMSVPATMPPAPTGTSSSLLMAGGVSLLLLCGIGYWWWKKRQQPQLPAALMNWREPDGPESLISIPFTPAGRSAPMPLPGESQNPNFNHSRGGFASSSVGASSTGSGTAAEGYPEAIMVELHDLKRKLKRFRADSDDQGAIKALTRHINSRKRTSPWVFLELLRLLQRSENLTPWLPMKPLFQLQFGQTAPDENKSLRADSLEDDIGLCLELTRLWPSSSTRTWIERWMLGTGTPIGSGPPLLTLQTYRDLLWVDEFMHHLTREAIDKRIQKLQSEQ